MLHCEINVKQAMVKCHELKVMCSGGKFKNQVGKYEVGKKQTFDSYPSLSGVRVT